MRRRVIVVHTILTRQYPATIIPDDYAQCPPNRTRDPARRGPRSIRRFSLLMIDPMNKYADRPYIKNRAIVGRPAWGVATDCAGIALQCRDARVAAS